MIKIRAATGEKYTFYKLLLARPKRFELLTPRFVVFPDLDLEDLDGMPKSRVADHRWTPVSIDYGDVAF